MTAPAGFVPGRTWCCTQVLRHRRPLLAGADNVHRLREAMRQARARHPFAMPAAVVLPDRVHCLWVLPAGDDDPVRRWRLVKRRFGAALGERNLWSDAGRAQAVADVAGYARLVDWIHEAPCRAGLVATPDQWPYSSYARFARLARAARGARVTGEQ